MLIDKFFTLSQGSAEALLILLLITSVLSITIIIERFLSLRKVYLLNQDFRSKAQDLLQSNSLKEIENLASSKDSLPSRALAYGLRHAKIEGEKRIS